MKFVLPAASAAVLAGLATPTAAETVDPARFDVAGLRLGMTPAEARIAIAAHFHIPAAAVQSATLPAIDLYKQPWVAAVSYSGKGETITAHFILSVGPLQHDRPFEAWQVSYETPWSVENKALLHTAAVQKYGQPRFDFAVAGWCLHVTNVACDSGQAKLELSNTGLTLSDDRYDSRLQALRAFLQRTPPKL